MSKYEVKTKLSNITQLKDGSFNYNQEIVWMKWDEKDRLRYRQSGKSMGEFGDNYSYRKQYQHDYHDSSGVKWVEPNITPQGKPLHWSESIKRSRTEPLTKEEIEWRHEQLKKDHEGYEYESDRNTGRTHKD